MIEIRNCSKAFGEIHAIDHVLMDFRTGRDQRCRKEHAASNGCRSDKAGRRRNPGGSGTGL